SIICAFGLASAAPRSPYRHLELCGIAKNKSSQPPCLWECSTVGRLAVVSGESGDKATPHNSRLTA
ncbi:MAG: hypothetical protein WAQ76_01930, partial [Gemmiger qucibialis]